MGLPRDRIETPPRTISPLLAAQMMLGGPMAQIGWLLFGFGSIFFWLFAWHADLTGWRFREGVTASVAGQSLGCRNTGYSVGGSRGRRGTPVYENRYWYMVDGQEFSGQSYSTGACLGRSGVTVEYLTAQPAFSRILGMRRGLLSPWALLAALFPGAGLGFAIAGLSRGRTRARLLRAGLPAAGRLTARVPTGSQVMGKTVYRMTLEFTARDGSVHSATVATNRPESLEDEAQESVLYDPENPDIALPIDGLPGSIALDDSGRIIPAGSKSFLTLPVLSLLCNAWFIGRVWSAGP